ncbi:MAG: hypothetical protein IPP33_09130 [Flavobacteriales bacterium]|nr:hypothetical protein [Flavobacteriales bacterium]
MPPPLKTLAWFKGSAQITFGVTLPLALMLTLSCTEPVKTPLPKESAANPILSHTSEPDSATLATRLQNPPTSTEQISQYIRRIFQDRDGNMWFGTTSDGVARYDPSASLRTEGKSLAYFTPQEGFSGNWVGGISQDEHGDPWFATGGGVSRYDPSATLSAGGTKFTRYTTKDGLASDQVYCLLVDKSGGLWFGTEEGVSRFDPSASLRTGSKTFTSFPIPASDLSKFPYYKYPKQINSMIQDKAGNIWFATNGGGVYRYDGKTLTNLSEADGLCNNFVQTVMEDRAGNLWFGTRKGGLCKYDGKTFTAYGRKDGVLGDQVWVIYQDSAGIIWIGASAYGLCAFDGKKFICYTERDGAGLKNVQSLFEDANGQLWIGTSGGVYLFNGGNFTNWTKEDAIGPD